MTAAQLMTNHFIACSGGKKMGLVMSYVYVTLLHIFTPFDNIWSMLPVSLFCTRCGICTVYDPGSPGKPWRPGSPVKIQDSQIVCLSLRSIFLLWLIYSSAIDSTGLYPFLLWVLGTLFLLLVRGFLEDRGWCHRLWKRKSPDSVVMKQHFPTTLT